MATRMTRETKELYAQQAVDHLRKMLKNGDTVYTVLKSRSGSGIYRHIAVIVAPPPEFENPVSNISNLVSDALTWKWHDDDSVGVSGAGLDVGKYLVRQLAERLFGYGDALKHSWL